MGIRIPSIPEESNPLVGTDKVIISAAAGVTRTTLLSTMGDWFIKTFTGFLQSSTGAIPQVLQTKIRRDVPLSPEDRGCVGDGVVDDTTNFGVFLDSANGRVNYLVGTYKLTSLLSKALSNAVFIGIPGVTKITGNFGYTTLKLLALNNVHFYGITFETTYTNAVDGSLALLHSIQTDVKDVSFRCCTFTSPNANIDGLGFYPRTTYADATAAGIDGLWIEDCSFENIGRIGCTLMNRGGGADKYTNARRVYFNRNKGVDLGLSGDYGFLLTLDGFGSNFEAIGNEGYNCLGTIIENTGWQHGKIADNKGMEFTGVCRLLSIDGTDAVNGNRPMLGLTVTGNKCVVPATDHSLISDCLNSFFAGNYFQNGGSNQAALMRRSFDCDFKGETYINDTVTGTFAFFSDETSSRNRWDGACIFDNSASGTNNATVRFADSCTDNIIQNGAQFFKGTGGSSFDQIASATLNYVEGFLNSWTPTIYGAGTAGTPTYSVQTGSYSLIGKICKFDCRVDITAKTGMVGSVRVSLPFTSANTVNGVQNNIELCVMVAAGITVSGGSTYFAGSIPPNVNYVSLGQFGSTNELDVDSADIAAATSVNLSGSYVIA